MDSFLLTSDRPIIDLAQHEDDLFAEEAPTRVFVIDTREPSEAPSVHPHLTTTSWDDMDGRKEWYPHDI